MAEVSRKRGPWITIGPSLKGKVFSERVHARFEQMLMADAAMREKEEAAPQQTARKKRGTVQGPQNSRIKIKLANLFSDGLPTREQLADSEFVTLVRKAFEKDPPVPDRKTILTTADRLPRKKTK